MQGSFFKGDLVQMLIMIPSSLGPLFWNLYQNDLTYLVESNICEYTDLEALMACDHCKNCSVCRT